MRNMTEIRTPFAGKRSAAKGVCCYKFQEDQFVQHTLTELLARHFKEHISCSRFGLAAGKDAAAVVLAVEAVFMGKFDGTLVAAPFLEI